MTNFSSILLRLERGDNAASDELFPLVYDELRQLASKKLAREKPGQTLQPTALVNEVYLRLTGGKGDGLQWEGRRHFFGAAARAMQQILVESARRKKRIKHGGDMERQVLIDVPDRDMIPAENLLALDEALGRLQQEDPEIAEVVRLRFFAGCSHDQAAEILGVSAVTVRRRWRYGRAWLRGELE